MICIAHFSQSLYSVNATLSFQRYGPVSSNKKLASQKLILVKFQLKKTTDKADVSSFSPSSKTSLGSSNGLFSCSEIYWLVLPVSVLSRTMKAEIFSPCNWTPQLDGVMGLSS